MIPHSPAADATLQVNWNAFSETWANLKIARTNRTVFNSILGISWLWFFGSIFLTSFAPFARDVLGGNEAVVTFLLTTFSIGIGVGALLTDRLSGGKVEIGLVPLGSIGMTVFARRFVPSFAWHRARATPAPSAEFLDSARGRGA